MNKHIISFLLVLFLVNSATVFSQRSSSSAYSFFGIGEKYASRTMEQLSMGGVGVAFKSSNYINFSNPAASADLRLTNYAVGGETSFLTVNSGKSKFSTGSTSLKYVAIGFPISKKAGMSFGVMPVSSVGYQFTNYKYTKEGKVAGFSRYKGKGGANKLYGAFGFSPAYGLSFGVEGGFIFGTLNKDILNKPEKVLRATQYKQDGVIRGGELKVGVQYKKELEEEKYITMGLAVSLQSNLSLKGEEAMYSVSFSKSGNQIPIDTLFNKNLNSKIILPAKNTIGIGYGKENKWYMAANFEFQEALSSPELIKNDAYKYNNSKTYSVGGFYIPKINSISSYLDRITYRAGIKYENTGLLIKHNSQKFTEINDFGINFGLGLPMGNQLSNLNIGLEYGKRGTANNNLIKENYINFGLSLSFTDVWFRKRRID